MTAAVTSEEELVLTTTSSSQIKSRRGKAKLRGLTGAAPATILAEIEHDLPVACPGFAEMTQAIRYFASSRLSGREKAVIGVVSALPGEGATTVALSLASALADATDNVVYVETQRTDTDTLLGQMGYAETSGLYGYLRNEANLDETLLATGRKGLSFLPAGPQDNAVQPLGHVTGIRSLMGELRQKFSISIIDLPPLLVSEDTPALLSGLDGIVLVVAAGKTNISDVQKAIALCGSVPIEGIFMNRASKKTPGWIASLLTSEGERGLV
jgi:succinoglycan biosynthesis transport protein ExoP